MYSRNTIDHNSHAFEHPANNSASIVPGLPQAPRSCRESNGFAQRPAWWLQPFKMVYWPILNPNFKETYWKPTKWQHLSTLLVKQLSCTRSPKTFAPLLLFARLLLNLLVLFPSEGKKQPSQTDSLEMIPFSCPKVQVETHTACLRSYPLPSPALR